MMSNVKNVRWVVAHEPIDLFVRAANAFAKEVHEKTDGQLNIEVMTLTEYSNKYNGGVAVSKYDVVNRMNQGIVEMSQLYTPELGQFNKDMHVLDMPFLFEDHEHAARVLEGQVGKQLLDGVAKNSNIRGLAFTYSGGFRMMPGAKAIEKMEDFAGLKVRVSERTNVAADTFIAVGAEPVQLGIEEVARAVADGTVDAGESTYPRYYSMGQSETCPYINDTKHSLFLTSIVMANSFWDTLSEDIKLVVAQAAFSAARLERAESLVDAELTVQQAKKDGIKVVELAQAEIDKFKAATKSLYTKYQDYFSPGLVEQIRAAA
jgi:TRAP-type transport system periplasmic protein